MSRPHSRSSSQNSIPNLNNDQILGDFNSIYDNTENENKQFTIGHPLGAILLQMKAENLQLKKKVGQNISTQESNNILQNLCDDFSQAMQIEQQSKASDITPADVENLILEKEMSYHLLNQVMAPPSKYSDAPSTLNAPNKQNEIDKLFPTKFSHRFSGQAGNSISIIEFLTSLNHAQSIAKLTKSEF